MKNFTTKVMAEVAIFAAIGWVLDFFQKCYSNAFWPNGGSIGIAMIAVVIITYRRGLVPGLITGLLMGLLDMMSGFYAIADTWYNVFFQLALDYIIAYPLVAVGCFLFRKLYLKCDKLKAVLFSILGVIVGGTLKLLSHFVSGILFWEMYCDFDKYTNLYTYSFIYNGLYMIICTLLTCVVMGIMAYRYPQFTKITKEEE